MTEPRGERRITRELLKGAKPVCVDCHRELEVGEARVPIEGGKGWRCGDCEYLRVRGK